MKNYTLKTLLIVWILVVSCDTESITNSFTSANPPTARIVILNEDEIAGKTIGDSIDLEISLEVHNMVPIKNIQFIIGFNGEYFSPSNLDEGTSMVNSSSYQFEDKPNFFSLSGEPYTDSDGDGEWDSGPAEEFYDFGLDGEDGTDDEGEGNDEYDQGEEFVDLNGNGSYDGDEESYTDENDNGEYDQAPISPFGLIEAEPNEFIGNLGIPSPDQNGNKWGDGDICTLHLSGIIYTESLITLDIIKALEYTDENSDAEASPHWDSWDITSSIEVASQYNPFLTLVQANDSEEGVIAIEFEIEDSPKIANFQAVILYNPEVLNALELEDHELLDFFNTTNYSFSYFSSNQEGRITLSWSHGIANDLLTDLIDEPMIEGSGGIIKLKFSIVDPSAGTTSLSLPKDNIIARGYSSTDNLIYDYEVPYWDIEENLIINF